MWTLFKIINIWWVLASTYIWMMTLLPMPLLLVVANIGMLLCFNLLPVNFKFDAKIGWIILAILLLTLWSVYIDGWINGIMTLLTYSPVLFLIQLPYEYQKDLLKFVTKWYAILLIPGLLLYWILLFIPLPSLGTFVHPNYEPYLNYLFYIKTTFTLGNFYRFNSFFLEPGHQAILSSFIMMANRYDFKRCPWLIVLAIAVVFSLSLAGYLLSLIGFILLKVDNLKKAFIAIGTVLAIYVGAMVMGGEESALNVLILDRLEYDKQEGIKGNNRFFNNTDFEYKKAVGTEYFWIGVKSKANMELISGAGYKIYILNYGMGGILFVILFYLLVIPTHPAKRYTLGFLIILTLCFMQRAYPFWYSWLFPYVVGIYIAKGDKSLEEDKKCYIETSE